MPSACAKVEKQNSLDIQDPLKQVQNLVEKKIRNLEKRKGKLEQLQQELADGKALHDDQKKAIKKFDDVIEMLDFFKEFNKSVNSIFHDHSKMLKKQSKKEQLDKQQQETERMKSVLLFQEILNGMGVEGARHDFMNGRNGAIKLENQQIAKLDELFKIIFPDRSLKEVVFDKQLNDCSDCLIALVEGKNREAFKGTTFKDLKELLTSINSCGYFDPKSITPKKVTLHHPGGDSKKVEASERVQEKIDPMKKYVSDNQLIASAQPSATTQFQPPHTEGYNFLQESRLEGTAHTINDPAVVAIAPIQTAYTTPYPVQGSEVMTNPNAAPTSESKQNPIPTQTFTNQNFAAIMGHAAPTFVPTVPLTSQAAMMGMQMQISPPNQDVMNMQNQSQHMKSDQSNQILSQQFQQAPIQPCTDQAFQEYHVDNRNVHGLTSQDKTPYYQQEDGNIQGTNFRGGYRGRGGRGTRGGSMNGYTRGGGQERGGRGGNRGYHHQGSYNNYGTNGQSSDKKGMNSNQFGGRGGGGLNRGRGASNNQQQPRTNPGTVYGNK